MVILSPATALANPPLAQNGAQTHPQPLIDLTQLAGVNVFEVGKPAFQRPVEVGHDGIHVLAIVPARLGFDGLTQLAQAFGELIGNTDMHFGNLSLWLDDVLPFRLTPCYDMLPMLWAPGPQGELVERVFSPLPPAPAAMDAWQAAFPMALEFWQNLAADESLSAEFRGFAWAALDTFDQLRRFRE